MSTQPTQPREQDTPAGLPRAPATPRPEARFWRSLEERADSPEFRRWLAAEFPNLPPDYLDGPTRRQFLKLMGASLGLAGLAACRWPKETIVPAARRPVNRVPGQMLQFATAIELGGAATGLLVTSYEGRPIKIEGNDRHPFSRGRTSHWMQASLLELYDPDRSRWPVERLPDGRALHRTWAEFEAFARPHFADLRARGGAGLAVLSEGSSSPTLADVRARFEQAFPEARWYEYEPVSRDHEIAGTRLAFGQACRPHLHLDRADVILSLDSDFLMLHPAAVRYAGDFAARRRADDGTMSRLYVLETSFTVTGSMADERYALRPGAIGAALLHIAAAVARRLGREPAPLPPPPTPAPPLAPAVAAAIADDLVAHAGRCVLIAGDRQPPEVHAAVCVLNAWLAQNPGGPPVVYTPEPEADRPPHMAALQDLAARIRSGAVQTLVILGGNPAATAPADVDFAGALAGVPASIRLGPYEDETARRCTWHLPQAHYLESWSDARAWDGTVSIVQPLIEPLHGGRTAAELLALLSGDELVTGHALVRRTLRQAGWAGADGPADFEAAWQSALHEGLVPGTAWPALTPTLAGTPVPAPPEPGGLELAFAPDYSVYDGRFANNAWLQEWPDPITKLTWGNAALVAPEDCPRLGIRRSGDVLRIARGDAALEIPACVLPGHAAGCITLPLGYGRGPAAGAVARGVGHDTPRLRTTGAAWVARDARVDAAGRRTPLVTTQDHHAIRSAVGDAEVRRRLPTLVREATLAEYRRHPDFARHTVHLPQAAPLWEPKSYDGHKWGMAIDLAACTGCGACVLACQAENNVPVVGPDEVAQGREMHWLRVDRYFREQAAAPAGHGAPAVGSADPPPAARGLRIVHQPMACVHCENAPCEQVCPVAATVHDEEGLNLMVYNRCIGTRYCSNNCPFKVRRFNWFYNHHGPAHPRSRLAGTAAAPGLLKQAALSDLEKLAHNPQVTVRSRGVMEKCTFCIQRISAVKIRARNERWPAIPDGAITPACAQACPTEAIVFGDLNDPASRVRRLHDHPRAYGLLDELNLRPRTMYLARLTNPAPAGPPDDETR